MATFAIEIADADVALVVGSICGQYGYQQTLPDPDNEGQTIDNPETANQFANRIVRNFIREVVTAYAVKQAESALDAARESVAGVSVTDSTGVAE